MFVSGLRGAYAHTNQYLEHFVACMATVRVSLGFGATRVCVGVVALVPELAWIVCVRQQNPDPARAHVVVVGSEQTRVFLGTSF